MLRLVEAKDLIFEWPEVRKGLEIVKAQTSDDWLPEDVYMSVKTGNAGLWIGEEDGEYLGFLVMQVLPTFHGSKLHIWAAYSATKVPLMRRFFPDIQAIAKAAKANKIGFTSKRAEWERVAQRLGFNPVQIAYECEV